MEIKRMREGEIIKSFSCFDLLVTKDAKIANYKQIQDVNVERNYREEFPIYGQFLKNLVIEINEHGD